MHELILGGGRSGKSRCAQSRAKSWLQLPGRRALLIATALPGDQEMRERIARHRADRAHHVGALETVEVPHELPAGLREWSAPDRGTLHQRIAAACERVTLMVAGIELGVKA